MVEGLPDCCLLLSVQESQLSSQEKLIGDLREELSSLKEQEASALSENKSMTGEVSEMKLQLEKLVYESKEAAITSDAMKEQNGELERELEELRVSFLSLPPLVVLSNTYRVLLSP